MCRSIKKLRNPQPAAPGEVQAAALQFVRKISGTRTPSKAQVAAFEEAVSTITQAAERLLADLGPPRAPKGPVEPIS